MSNIQAAIGCAQLERIEDLIKRKKQIFNQYKQAFSSYSEIKMNFEPKGTCIGAWMTNIVFDKSTNVTREQISRAFKQKNVDARVFFWPLSNLPMFKTKKENKFSYDIPKRAINLPSYHDITLNQLKRVVSVIDNLININ